MSRTLGVAGLAVGLAVTLAALVGISAAAPTRVTAAADRSTFVIGQRNEVPPFSPFRLSAGGWSYVNQVYNLLVRLDAKRKPHPELATSWALSKDNTSIRLKLRRGVTFHSGKPFTSADVVTSLRYIQTPTNPGNVKPLALLIKGVRTPDPYTAVLVFKQPLAPIIVYSFLDLFFVMDTQADLVRADAGTGPWKVSQRIPGVKTVLVRNDSYWGKRPPFERVEYVVVPDPQTQMIQLRTGAIDYADNITIQSLLSVRGNKSIVSGSAIHYALLFTFNINTTRPPLNKPLVRKALSYAVDRQRIASTVFGPYAKTSATPTCSVYAPDGPYNDPAIAKGCGFNLAKAKQLLAKAGYPNGFTFTMNTATSIVAEGAQSAQILQSDLAKIGVTMKIEDWDAATATAKYNIAHNYQAYATRVGFVGRDPAVLFYFAIPFAPNTNNTTNFVDKRYTEWAAQTLALPTVKKRKVYFKKIGERLLQQNWVIPISWFPFAYAASLDVKGLNFNSDGMLILANAQKTR